MLRGCGKLRGLTSCEVQFSTSLQPDKNLYVCVYVCTADKNSDAAVASTAQYVVKVVRDSDKLLASINFSIFIIYTTVTADTATKGNCKL